MEHQDRLDKERIDRTHREDILVLGRCLACGLPHGKRCQCQTFREAMAGRGVFVHEPPSAT